MNTATTNPTTPKQAAAAFVAFERAFAHVCQVGGFTGTLTTTGVGEGVGDEGQPEGRIIYFAAHGSFPRLMKATYLNSAIGLVQTNERLPQHVREAFLHDDEDGWQIHVG